MEKRELKIYLALTILALFTWVFLLVQPFGTSQPYNETSILNTTVNITNAAPFVFNVEIPSSINLVAYDTVTVDCNVSVNDYDNNTAGVNATLHYSGVPSDGLSDQNNLYWNTTCTRVTPTDFITNFTCTFEVNYFANNGTWYCNVTAIDDQNATNTNISNPGTIEPLVAIKMPEIIDYGEMSVGDTSSDVQANVTNAGNRDANISVEGWGSTPGDNLAMTCDYGNIGIGNEKYDVFSGTDFLLMYPLTSSTSMIPGYFVPQRTSESQDSIGSTYWRLQIPSGAGGVCDGKILFTASDRGN